MKHFNWFILIVVTIIIKDNHTLADNYIFTTSELDTDNPLPTLANGYIGFVIYSDTIYVNRLYNGQLGESHRARIPNFANIQLEMCQGVQACTYSLNMKNGIFSAHYQNDMFDVELITYPHRFYHRSIVNELKVRRKTKPNNDDEFEVKLIHNPGPPSIDLNEIEQKPLDYEDVDATFYYWKTKIVEYPGDILQDRNVYMYTSNIPKLVVIPSGTNEASFTWITSIGFPGGVPLTEFLTMLLVENDSLLEKHTDSWNEFWTSSDISVENNDELAKILHASLFYLASALPSPNVYDTFGYKFGGLSPSGLGLNGYQGHSFWDTEIWMYPVILLLNPKWGLDIITYRYDRIDYAKKYANETGYKGIRFPWESAYTGAEVIPDCCQETADHQQHITADVAFAIRQYFTVTQNIGWLLNFGRFLIYDTALFWESRVTYNPSNRLYEIRNVMGPDEFHANISNNAYTNVIAAQNLFFGKFISCVGKSELWKPTDEQPQWASIAKSLKLPYDQINQVHLQYDGFTNGTVIKQADSILLGYPLQYPMDPIVKKNNLKFYEKSISADGPAMTWSMHTIGLLDIGEDPTDNEFRRTFEPYIRKPFYIWDENADGRNGAGNFLTGAGGFLQLIVYGYAGIRLQDSKLIIRNPKLPPGTTKLTLNGIQFLDTKISLMIIDTNFTITFDKLVRDKYQVLIDNKRPEYNYKEFTLQKTQVLTLDPYQKVFFGCEMESDWTIGHESNGRILKMGNVIWVALWFVSALLWTIH